MEKNQNKNTVKDVRKYVRKYYKFTHNVISGEVFCERRNGKKIKNRFVRDEFIATLCERFGGVPGVKIRTFVKGIPFEAKNPLKTFLEGLFFPPQHPRQKNPFEKLGEYFELADAPPFTFASALESHLVRAIRCVVGGRPNRLIFTLISQEQNLGKTQFIEWLFHPKIKEYCMSKVPIRKEKWEATLANRFLCNIDDFASVSRTDDAHLKAMVSQHSASIWIPFKRRCERRPRIASFFATKNLLKSGKNILSPEDSNSRFLIFNVKSINWDYCKDINVDDLWRWAASRALDESYVAEPSIKEVRALEGYNKRFSKVKKKRLIKKKVGFQVAAMYTVLGGILAAAARVFVPMALRALR